MREEGSKESSLSLFKRIWKKLIGLKTHPKGDISVGLVTEIESTGYSVAEERMADVETLKKAGEAAMAKYPPTKDANGKVTVTFCNMGLADVADAMGCTVIRGKRANEIHDFALANPGLFRKDSGDRAAKHALRGGFAFASMQGPDVTGDGIPDSSGHVATVAPMPMENSPTLGRPVPVVYNVGKDNRAMPVSQAFAVGKYGEPAYFLFGETA